MALNNFAALTAQMQDWAIDRPDLVNKFQDCIDLCINDVNQVLRMREQQKTVTLVSDEDGYATLPDDYLEWRRVYWTGNPLTVLEPLTPEGDVDVYPSPYGSTPSHFELSGNTIKVHPLDSETPIKLMYWAKVPYLKPTAPDDVNWLLTKNSNVVLFGAMKYVEVFKRNQAGMQAFGQLYSAEIDGMVRTGKRSQWSRTRARVAGRSTP